jgi:hypothetical protein
MCFRLSEKFFSSKNFSGGVLALGVADNAQMKLKRPPPDVRFAPQSRHASARSRCLLVPKAGWPLNLRPARAPILHQIASERCIPFASGYDQVWLTANKTAKIFRNTGDKKTFYSLPIVPLEQDSLIFFGFIDFARADGEIDL